MKKKFYTYALFTVLGTALLSLLVSVLYLIAFEKVDEGESLFKFLFYSKSAFDVIAMFAGFATIIYAFSHLDFVDGVLSVGIFFCSFIMFVIFEVIAMNITSGEDASLDTVFYFIYYCFGKDFISQMVPAIIAGVLSYLLTHGKSSNISKPIDLKNPTQKSIFFFCIIIFALNFLSYIFIDESMFPFLFEEDFYITVNQFKAFMLSLVKNFVFDAIIYIAVQYAVLTLANVMYEKFAVETKNSSDNSPQKQI